MGDGMGRQGLHNFLGSYMASTFIDEKICVGHLSATFDSPDDNCVTSFHDMDVEKSAKEITNEDVYTDSLLWRLIVDVDDHLIDAEFEEVLSYNGILGHFDDLSDEFDMLYGDYFTKDNFKELDMNEDQFENSHSSPPEFKSTKSINDSEELGKCASVPVPFYMKSTPASCRGLENSRPTSGTGMMDSGFFDSFDSGNSTLSLNGNSY